MVIQIIRGSRSEKHAAHDWKCNNCGNLNKKSHFFIFDLPAFHCRKCRIGFTGIIYFNLADVLVNGRSIIPDVKCQGDTYECVAFALAHAQEFNDIIENIIMNDNSAIEKTDPMVLANAYHNIFGEDEKFLGYHKMLYISQILKEYARKIIKDPERSTRSDVVQISMAKHEQICQFIADGRGIVACIRSGKTLLQLKFGEVYVPPVFPSVIHHAVMLIGAVICEGDIIYFFLNSSGKEFCALRDSDGNIVVGGIGLVEGRFSCTPVVLSRSWEIGVTGKLSGSWRKDLTRSEVVEETECLQVPKISVPTFANKDPLGADVGEQKSLPETYFLQEEPDIPKDMLCVPTCKTGLYQHWRKTSH